MGVDAACVFAPWLLRWKGEGEGGEEGEESCDLITLVSYFGSDSICIESQRMNVFFLPS